MTTRAFSTLASKVNANVVGCPIPMIIQHVRDAAIRVCERALVWRYEQDAFVLTPGVYQYSFVKPDDARVHAVMLATINGSPLEILTLDDATKLYPDWPITSSTPPAIEENGSEPRSVSQVDAQRFVVLPAPDAAQSYSVRMVYALKPSRSALEMDESVFDEYETAILHGALQTLFAIPEVQWSDKAMTTYHAKQFMFTLGEARAQANLGVFRGSLSVRFPPFA